MPGLIQETPFKTFTVNELHPTFAAEITGANFQDMSEEGLQEVRAVMAKVRLLLCLYTLYSRPLR